MRAPISLCVITRDDPHLDSCLSSIAPHVAEVCVVLTSPRDSVSRPIAEKYGARIEVVDCNDAEDRITDFSRARNASFALATQPWVLWLDSDDIVRHPEKLAELVAGKPEGTCFLLPYEYAYDALGRVVTRQYRERLVHGKDRMHWLFPVHEVLVAKAPNTVQFLKTDDVVVSHQRQYHPKPTEPGRNLRILTAWMAEHPDDVRNMYYTGLECANNGDTAGALEWLTKYLDKSGWDDERAMACYKLVELYEAKKDYREGLRAAFRSLETVDWYESHYAVARMFYFLQQWERCAHWAAAALARPKTETLLFVNEADRHEIHAIYNVALNKLGRVEEAYASCLAGLEHNPSHPLLLKNRPLYERHLELPEPVRVSLPTDPKRLRVAFVTGPSLERWDPDSILHTGIGGSETMLDALSRRLATLGHEVTVYASPRQPGAFSGVSYRDQSAAREFSCDVLIVSRFASYLDKSLNIQAKLRLLWCHDVIAHQATPERLLRADRVLALSAWHKDNLCRAHTLHPDHVEVTRNGVDLGRYRGRSVARDPHRMINSSSPDRSWPVLLELFPRIRERVPGATLHLYYGFDNWRRVAAGDKLQTELIDRTEHAARNTPGVHYHGRVGPQELADAFLSSALWAYPTWFTETSCISAMEAQAAGCRIVTSARAGLVETVGDAGALLEGEWTDPSYQAAFVDACVAVLQGPGHRELGGERFDLDTLAADWEAMFLRLLEAKEVNPIVPYQPTRPYAQPVVMAPCGSPDMAVDMKDRHTRVKLNIACGPNIFPFDGWTNYDLWDFEAHFAYVRAAPLEGMPEHQQKLAKYLRSRDPRRWVETRDMTKPFHDRADASVDAIYVGQAIEHLNPIYEAPAFLKECHRMLKPGGVLRMTTPDMEAICGNGVTAGRMHEWEKDQPAWFASACHDAKVAYLLFGACGPNSTRTHYEGHHMAYTRESMTEALVAAGFRGDGIAYYDDPKRSALPWLAEEVRDEGLSHSLLVEAVK